MWNIIRETLFGFVTVLVILLVLSTGANAITVSNVTNATPMATTVWILWNVSSDANNTVEYSINSDLSGSSFSAWNNSTSIPKIKLWSLQPNMTYYYRVWSYNATDESDYVSSIIYNFTTRECVSYKLVNATDTSITGIDHPIQEAIDMICLDGGIVELAPEVHTPTATIQIINRTNITIRGGGAVREDTEIKYDGYYPTFDTFYIEDSENITIENMYIHSTATGYISSEIGSAIFLSMTRNVTISNIKAERLNKGVETKFWGWDVPPEEQWNKRLTVKDCSFLYLRGGIYFLDTHNSVVTNCDIGHIQSWMGINLNVRNPDNIIENNLVHHCANSGIQVYSSSHNNIVRNNICYSNNNYGISILGGPKNTIVENNTCYDNNWAGIGVDTAASLECDGTIIQHNKVYRNSDGISFGWDMSEDADSTDNIVRSNTIFNNTNDGIVIKQTRVELTIKNNIIYGNGGYGINQSDSSSLPVEAHYNDAYANALGNYHGIGGSNNLEVDPKFYDVANNDVHLKSTAGRWNGSAWVNDNETSPCIDAGDPSDDYSNEPKPNGGRINMGAYGNTPEASKSPSKRKLPVARPVCATGIAILIVVAYWRYRRRRRRMRSGGFVVLVPGITVDWLPFIYN